MKRRFYTEVEAQRGIKYYAKILQQKEASVFLGYNLEEAIFTVSVWLEFKTS